MRDNRLRAHTQNGTRSPTAKVTLGRWQFEAKTENGVEVHKKWRGGEQKVNRIYEGTEITWRNKFEEGERRC